MRGDESPADSSHRVKSQTTTFDLLERFHQGNRDAFSSLFERYRRRLYMLIHYKLSPEKRRPEDIEELVQETFLAAFEDLDRFEYRSQGSFLRWISTIAEHVIADAARSQGRQKRKAETTRFRSETNPLGPDPLDSLSPSRAFTEREEAEILLSQLNALPEQYREVILLARIEGLSTLEISDRLGKSRQNVALLLHRAIQRFREVRKGA